MFRLLDPIRFVLRFLKVAVMSYFCFQFALVSSSGEHDLLVASAVSSGMTIGDCSQVFLAVFFIQKVAQRGAQDEGS